MITRPADYSRAEVGFIGAWKNLELSNRVARLTALLHQKLHDAKWARQYCAASARGSQPNTELEVPDDSGREWIVDQLQDLQGEDYRKRQSQLVGLCLRAALVCLAKEHKQTEGDEISLLLQAASKAEVDMSVLVPSIGSADFSAESPRHFGSIAFHKADELASAGGATIALNETTPRRESDAHHKENLGSFESLWQNREKAPAFHQAVKHWVRYLISEPRSEPAADSARSDQYVERLRKILAGDDDLAQACTDESILTSEHLRKLFQSVISPILEKRQSMFLAEVDSQVPLILIRRTAADHEEVPGSLGTAPSNLIWLAPNAPAVLEKYLNQNRDCASPNKPCPLIQNGKAPFDRLKQQLENFLDSLVWSGDQEIGSRGLTDWKDLLEQQKCSHLAEFQIPYAFFDQAVLISCARAASDDQSRAGAARGSVSLSLAVTPHGYDLDCNRKDEVLARWASLVATGLHQLVTDVDAAITAIDQEVDRRRLLRHSLRSAVGGVLARSMAHNLGSHLIANTLELTADAQSEGFGREDQIDSVLRHVQERMIWIAEAASSAPSLFMGLPFSAAVIEPFFVLRDRNSLVVRNNPIPRLVLLDELHRIHRGCSSRERIPEVGLRLFLRTSGDPSVAIPSGILGRQAFFVIAENLLRNAVKFGPPSSKLDLCVSAGDVTEWPELVEIVVWDSWRRYEKRSWERINSFHPPSSRDESLSYESPNAHWRFLDESTFEPVSGGGGFKEMRVAAAWLRGLKLEDALLPGKANSPPLLQPVLVNEELESESFSVTCTEAAEAIGDLKDWHIGYRFFVRRSMRLVVVDSNLAKEVSEPRSGGEDITALGVRVFESLKDVVNSEWAAADCLVLGRQPAPGEDGADSYGPEELNRRRFDLPIRFLVGPNSAHEWLSSVELAAPLSPDEFQRLDDSLKGTPEGLGIVESLIAAWDAAILRPRNLGEINIVIKLGAGGSYGKGILEPAKDAIPALGSLTRAGLKGHYRVTWTDEEIGPEGMGGGLEASSIFDHHHDITRRDGWADRKWGTWSPPRELGERAKLLSYEAMSSNSLTMALLIGLRREPHGLVPRSVLPALHEGSLPAIVIVDSRIELDKFHHESRLRLGKISVCAEITEDVLGAVRLSARDAGAVFVVVHYALFDRLPSESPFLQELRAAGATLVWISSDRAGWALRKDETLSGTAETADPISLPFAPAATVRRFVAEGCKLGLVQLLLAARRLSR